MADEPKRPNVAEALAVAEWVEHALDGKTLPALALEFPAVAKAKAHFDELHRFKANATAFGLNVVYTPAEGGLTLATITAPDLLQGLDLDPAYEAKGTARQKVKAVAFALAALSTKLLQPEPTNPAGSEEPGAPAGLPVAPAS